MNHLEQLVAEWLQYQEYFVRTGVLVGRRPHGGFDGELDVIALHPRSKHLLHVECSLDSISWEKRHERFAKKFEHGVKHIPGLFRGLDLPSNPDQVALLQYAGAGSPREVGGARLVTVIDFTREIFAGLKGTSPAAGAVPTNLPLLRTMQLAAQMPYENFPALERDRRLVPDPIDHTIRPATDATGG